MYGISSILGRQWDLEVKKDECVCREHGREEVGRLGPSEHTSEIGVAAACVLLLKVTHKPGSQRQDKGHSQKLRSDLPISSTFFVQDPAPLTSKKQFQYIQPFTFKSSNLMFSLYRNTHIT